MNSLGDGGGIGSKPFFTPTDDKLHAERVKCAKLEAEVRELEDKGLSLMNYGFKLGVEVHDIKKERDNLLTLLRKIEWRSRDESHFSGSHEYRTKCDTCGNQKHVGHLPDCALGNALEES